MEVSPVRSSAETRAIPTWMQVFLAVVTVAAVFTALCCIGFDAATGLASALGATFMLRDDSLRPILVFVLSVTAIAIAFMWRKHGNALPLVLTVASGATLFALICGFAQGESDGDAHHMSELADAGTSAAISGARAVVVWIVLAFMLVIPIWDVALGRRWRRGSVAETPPGA